MKFMLVPPVESFPVKNYPTLKPLQATLSKLLTHCAQANLLLIDVVDIPSKGVANVWS